MHTIKWEQWADPYKKDDGGYSDSYSKIINMGDGPPITEETRPGKQYNFWLGHANFNISELVIKAIEGVEGVETLDVFSRYRFRVGIGKNFIEDDVKFRIENLFKPKEVPSLFKLIGSKIKTPYWAIVKTDRLLEIVKGQSIKEVEEKCQNKMVLEESTSLI